MANITNKTQVVQRGANVLQRMQTHLWIGLKGNIYIYPRIKHKHVAYYRFIDDIFFIWTGSEAELLKFFHEINSVHDTIKFDCNHSNKSINVLDTTVYITQNKLSTKLFRKPTDRPSHLHYNSYHPRTQKGKYTVGASIKTQKNMYREQTSTRRIEKP